MSSLNYYGIKKRLNALTLIKRNIIDSASLSFTTEVKTSTEIVMKSINSTIIQISSKLISFEITKETFQKDSDGYQTLVAIYKYDKLLFDQVIERIFNEIVEDDNFKKIIKFLTTLEDNCIKTDAFCKLYKFISRIYENLWGFECAVSKLLKDEHLKPEEIEKLQNLLKDIKECSQRHLIASSIASSFEYDY
ncbi:uncharacterized protein LOC129915462 [Episyrphus balteatus]|uniref:uncharacterized protein LOC129915462 n=1 Tax=Episyrphus balteatus TaxID=286459 RepID=UPI002485EEA5|nr:uncharacterized protein LOC129915462 [Episyrphus balteatus]